MPQPSAPWPQEKRRNPRLEEKIPLKITSDLGDILTETKNLSCSGAYCRVSQRLEPMTRLRIHLLLPMRKNDKVTTKRITCQGIVVRVEAAADSKDYFDTAIFFSDIAPKDTRNISEFIESVTNNKDHGKYN
ncbi:MAG: PilZ domain-containing protein [Candidatus Omnitrophica bacterium]|nr:PilZ domain-containing protein [Candidatus Omnitrophota bacterium]